jgi:hypothetical protein
LIAKERIMNPTQINQGGAQNQEKQPPQQTGSQQRPPREAGGGLRGDDKQQAALRDVDSSAGDPPQAQPQQDPCSPHQRAQHGAEVRSNPPQTQGAEPLPEGLTRERKSPYNKDLGRGENPTQVPGNRPSDQG